VSFVFLLGALGAAGCAFEEGQFGEGGESPAPGSGGGDGEAGDTGSGDTGGGSGGSTGDETPAPLVHVCDDADAVLCYDFDDLGDGSVLDSSTYGNDADVSGVVVHLPGRDGDALLFSDTISATVAETALLDITSMTIELWIKPSAIPGAGRAGLVDNNGQYGFFLHPDGQLRCTPGDGADSRTAVIAVDRWSHVACTVDGTAVRIYVDGVEVGSGSSSGALPTAGSEGSAVGMNSPSGDHFEGLMDSLRVWKRPLLRSETCASAGASPCPGEG